jgi:hypothetical protein
VEVGKVREEREEEERSNYTINHTWGTTCDN